MEDGGRVLENLTQEEIEYRRYLKRRIRRRKRRRKVIIARAALGIAGAALAVGLFFLIRAGVTRLFTDKQKGAVAKATVEPSAKPDYIIPDGYDKIYDEILALVDKYPEAENILMNLSQYPANVAQLFIKNPETLSFVVNYPKHKNDAASFGEISEEEVKSGIPLLNQWDERWGYVKYGGDILAISGCGPTCMSMIYSGLLKNTSMSPADMAQYCIDNNYYIQGEGTSWDMMLDGARDLGLDAERIGTDAGTIKAELEKGRPVICSVGPGDFTDTGHFIVLAGIDKSSKAIVNDPNSIARSKKRWNIKKIQSQIRAAWSYAAR